VASGQAGTDTAKAIEVTRQTMSKRKPRHNRVYKFGE
jgi:hypothetical protein